MAARKAELAAADRAADPEGWATLSVKYGRVLYAAGGGYTEEARRHYQEALTVFGRDDHPRQWYTASLLLLQLLADVRYARNADEAVLRQAVAIANELSDTPQAAPAEGLAAVILALKARALTGLARRDPEWYEIACAAQRVAAAAAQPDQPVIAADARLALAELLIFQQGDETEAIGTLKQALTVYRPGDQPTGWVKTHFYLGRLLAARAMSCSDLLAACQHVENAAIVKPPAIDAHFYAMICQELAGLLTDSRCPEDSERLDRALHWSEECLRHWPEEDFSHRMEHADLLGHGYFRRYEERHDPADLQRAATLLDQAAALARETGASAKQAIEYGHDAAVVRKMISTDQRQNLELAIRQLTALLDDYGSQMTPDVRARVRQNLGTAYEERIAGDPADNQERAIDHLEAALADYNREVQPDEWASIAHNLSNACWKRITGDHGENLEKAIALAEAAAQIRTRKKDPRLWARTMHSLGNLYFQRQFGNRTVNLEQSIRFSQAALEVETKEALPDAWAGAQRNLGNAYLERVAGDRRENLETAVACFRDALRVTSRQRDLMKYGETLLGLGNALGTLSMLVQDSEQEADAVATYELAASAFAELGSPERRATAMFNLAMLLSEVSPDSSGPALAALRQCLPVWDAENNLLRAPYVYRMLALLSDRAGQTTEAYKWICKALEVLEVLYVGATAEDSKTALVADSADWYQFAVDLALRSGASTRAALLLAERGRARMLRDAVVPLQPGWNIPAELLAQESGIIRRRRQAWESLSAVDPATGTPERGFAEAQAVTGELAALWEEMRNHPGGDDYVATRKGSISWEQLHAWIERQPTGFALLEYVVIPRSTVADRVVAFVVRQDQPDPVAVEIPISINAIARCAVALYREMDGSASGRIRRETWDRIALPLVATVKPLLEGIRLLCIIPHILLHHFPLHALGDPGATLLDEMAVYYSPSATLAMRLGQAVRASDGTSGVRALVAGDSLGDLPHARLEAEYVGRTLGMQPLIGTHATVSAVLAKLPEATLAHFACHGYLRIDDPTRSAILLADGALTAGQLQAIGLNCDLLVLSGCDTGFQPLERTLEVGGLPSALIAAGARRAVGGLWPVNDEATERLFTAFYQKLSDGGIDAEADEVTRSVAGCLRAAALALRETQPERYFWAPFIVVGSW